MRGGQHCRPGSRDLLGGDVDQILVGLVLEEGQEFRDHGLVGVRRGVCD